MLNVIILAAGKGKRMKSPYLLKVLHQLGGQSILEYVIKSSLYLRPDLCIIVTQKTFPIKNFNYLDVKWVTQELPMGTGSAVIEVFKDSKFSNLTGDTLVLCGDTPLIKSGTLKKFLKRFKKLPRNSIMIIGMHVNNNLSNYGRIIKKSNNIIDEIVEYTDCNSKQREINLCNTGTLFCQAEMLKYLVNKIPVNKNSNEYYLTDCIKIAKQEGIKVFLDYGDINEFQGINTQSELAQAELILQDRWRDYWLNHGVTLVDPKTVYFSHDTFLTKGIFISPFVCFGPKVKILKKSKILSFCYLQEVKIGEECNIGPFAHIRGNVTLEGNNHIGNFVEVKNSNLKSGVKVKHLSYVGDSDIGRNSNIGAGTITCNYNGYEKAKTTVGSDVLIGANSTLIAPLNIGSKSIIGAGSVIKENVPENSLGISRSKQIIKDNWSKMFHMRHNNKIDKEKK